jgi:hypothetical protein
MGRLLQRAEDGQTGAVGHHLEAPTAEKDSWASEYLKRAGGWSYLFRWVDEKRASVRSRLGLRPSFRLAETRWFGAVCALFLRRTCGTQL